VQGSVRKRRQVRENSEMRGTALSSIRSTYEHSGTVVGSFDHSRRARSFVYSFARSHQLALSYPTPRKRNRDPDIIEQKASVFRYTEGCVCACVHATTYGIGSVVL